VGECNASRGEKMSQPRSKLSVRQIFLSRLNPGVMSPHLNTKAMSY